MELELLGAIVLGLVVVVAKMWGMVNEVMIELKAMQRSTHTLTYIDPLTQNFSKPPTGKERDDMDSDPLDTLN